MSPLLPMKETSREVVVEVARSLQPWFPEITAAWRQRMFAEFDFDGRAMAALERLTIGTGFSIFSQTDFAAFYDNLQHFGERLAKLKVSARAVARSLEIYQQLIDPYLERIFPPHRLPEAVAAMETLSWASYVAVSGGVLRRAEDRSGDAAVGAGRGAFGRKSGCAAGAGAEDRDPDLQRESGIDPAERRRAAGAAGRRRRWDFGDELEDLGLDDRHRRRVSPARSRRPASPRFCPTCVPRTMPSIPSAARTGPRRCGECRCKFEASTSSACC